MRPMTESETTATSTAPEANGTAGTNGDQLRDEQKRAMLAGYAVLAETCAEALLNEPSETVLGDVRRVAQALGDTRFDGIQAGPELTQRYYDRLFVSSSPYFVPLVESSITKRVTSNGKLTYGPLRSARGDHALACYREVGFDYRALRGYEMTVKSLHPDSLAAELAFLAELARAAAGEQAEAPAARRLLADFLRRHAGWFADAADCLAERDDDLYARVAALAAESTAELADALK